MWYRYGNYNNEDDIEWSTWTQIPPDQYEYFFGFDEVESINKNPYVKN